MFSARDSWMLKGKEASNLMTHIFGPNEPLRESLTRKLLFHKHVFFISDNEEIFDVILRRVRDRLRMTAVFVLDEGLCQHV